MLWLQSYPFLIKKTLYKVLEENYPWIRAKTGNEVMSNDMNEWALHMINPYTSVGILINQRKSKWKRTQQT